MIGLLNSKLAYEYFFKHLSIYKVIDKNLLSIYLPIKAKIKLGTYCLIIMHQYLLPEFISTTACRILDK